MYTCDPLLLAAVMRGEAMPPAAPVVAQPVVARALPQALAAWERDRPAREAAQRTAERLRAQAAREVEAADELLKSTAPVAWVDGQEHTALKTPPEPDSGPTAHEQADAGTEVAAAPIEAPKGPQSEE